MKRLVLLVTLLLALPSLVNAEIVVADKNSKLVADYDKKCNCLVVKTNKAEFRIYPCGKIDKLV